MYRQMFQKAIPSWDGRVAVHHIAYNADGHVHRAIPYLATDPRIIALRAELFQSVEIGMQIVTWQGPFAPSCHLDASLTSAECTRVGMQFALLIDPWCAKLGPKGVDNNYTQNVINALNDPTTKAMLAAASYVPEKYILDFNSKADLLVLAATFPSYKFLKQGEGFSWISIDNKITESKARNASSVANLKNQHANMGMRIASVCFSFDDSGMPLPAGVQSQAAFDAAGGKRDLTKGVWGDDPARILESFDGLFGEQQLATIWPKTPIIAIISGTDYDEQSSGPLEKVLAERAGVIWPS